MDLVNAMSVMPAIDSAQTGPAQIDPTRPLATWAGCSVGEPPVSLAEAEAFASLFAAIGGGADSWYAECRLSGARQLDLLVSFAKGSRHLYALREVLAARAQDAPLAARMAWQEADSFVQRWTNPDDPLCDAVSAIWLEFDDVLGSAGAAAPSISACVVPRYGLDYEPSAVSRRRQASALGTVQRALDPNGGSELRLRLGRALAEVRGEGRFIHLSVMTARPSRALKLYGSCSTADLPAYLERIGLGARRRPIETFLQACGPADSFGEQVYFDLNLTALSDASRAPFGIAFSQQNQLKTAPGDVGRRAVLDRLSELHLCTREQARALRHWVEGARSAEGLVSGDLRPHHFLDVKAVLDERGWSAKAYLGFTRLRSPFLIGPRSAQAGSA